MERIEDDKITKRGYVRNCAGRRSVGRLRKRWIDTVKDCLRKRGVDVSQARRMVGVCEGQCLGHSLIDEPQTLMRCPSCGLPQLYEALEGWKSICS